MGCELPTGFWHFLQDINQPNKNKTRSNAIRDIKTNKTKTAKMSLVIGLDTGGTYTDAALFDVDQGVVHGMCTTP